MSLDILRDDIYTVTRRVDTPEGVVDVPLSSFNPDGWTLTSRCTQDFGCTEKLGHVCVVARSGDGTPKAHLYTVTKEGGQKYRCVCRATLYVETELPSDDGQSVWVSSRAFESVLPEIREREAQWQKLYKSADPYTLETHFDNIQIPSRDWQEFNVVSHVLLMAVDILTDRPISKVRLKSFSATLHPWGAAIEYGGNIPAEESITIEVEHVEFSERMRRSRDGLRPSLRSGSVRGGIGGSRTHNPWR
ncbi:hypothetical protein M231_04360 [Tremella mesenterica]|uniref:Uncharacterized protein n=1 Tax=Tremella mesenterica TaxID=5217 RepID=A0A4Q1BKK3_TREME|nr:hypothetical protein M231_04360 [Tremella mesenterica]